MKSTKNGPNSGMSKQAKNRNKTRPDPCLQKLPAILSLAYQTIALVLLTLDLQLT